jgi:hypothetical protein
VPLMARLAGNPSYALRATEATARRAAGGPDLRAASARRPISVRARPPHPTCMVETFQPAFASMMQAPSGVTATSQPID